MRRRVIDRQKSIYFLTCVVCIATFIISTNNKEEVSWYYGITGVLCLLSIYLIDIAAKNKISADPLLATVFSWVLLSLIATIPLYSISKNFPLAYFDTVSQITSTGTAAPNVSNSTSLYFWRSYLCFVGGMYSIFLIFSRSEATIIETESSLSICIACYISLVIMCILLIKICGIKWIDASCLGMRLSSLSFYDTNLDNVTNNVSFLKRILSIIVVISWISFSFFQIQQKKQFLNRTIFSDKLALISILFIIVTIMLLIIEPHIHPTENSILTTLAWVTGIGIDTQSISIWPPIVVMMMSLVTCLYKNETNEAGISLVNLKSLINKAKKEIIISLHPSSIVEIYKSYQDIPQQITLNLTLYLCSIFAICFLLNISGQSISTSLILALASLNNMGISWNDSILPSNILTTEQATLLTIAMWAGRIGFVRIFISIVRTLSFRDISKLRMKRQ